MSDARRCRMCGQAIDTRRIVYGRTARADLWFVHTATDQVPCDPADRAAHEQRQREAGTLRRHDPSANPSPLSPPSPKLDTPYDIQGHTHSHTRVYKSGDTGDERDFPHINKGQTTGDETGDTGDPSPADDLLDSYFL